VVCTVHSGKGLGQRSGTFPLNGILLRGVSRGQSISSDIQQAVGW
jgi:hypothetical protein